MSGIPLGDLGHPRVDGRLLTALLLRSGPVAAWLTFHGVDAVVVSATVDLEQVVSGLESARARTRS